MYSLVSYLIMQERKKMYFSKVRENHNAAFHYFLVLVIITAAFCKSSSHSNVGKTNSVNQHPDFTML